MADVFISYARSDRERVAPMVAAIEAQGWMPNDVPPGNITGAHILSYVFGKGPRLAECGVFIYDSGEKSREEFDRSLFAVNVRNVKTRVFS